MPKTKRKPFTPTEAKIIGAKLGITWEQFDLAQFRVGLNAELADGTYQPLTNFASEDSILVGKVVRAHLNENPDYYTEWAAMEKAAEQDHAGKRTILGMEATVKVA
jgi:hypothetical protein